MLAVEGAGGVDEPGRFPEPRRDAVQHDGSPLGRAYARPVSPCLQVNVASAEVLAVGDRERGDFVALADGRHFLGAPGSRPALDRLVELGGVREARGRTGQARIGCPRLADEIGKASPLLVAEDGDRHPAVFARAAIHAVRGAGSFLGAVSSRLRRRAVVRQLDQQRPHEGGHALEL